MTKAELAAKISSSTGITKKEATVLLESFFNIIKEQLQAGETIKISGFGSFTVTQKNARRGRNPQTGEAITIEARKVLSFKPGNVLRDALNR